ncbi:hypothetical protein LAZ67_7001275 [Cordylochernes scorpioides]|uniref:Endonuclease n=1 Tax=Cordylochernes scorpioides TaxID=51811 RepID=A0ABY6KM54_9ARAC|nr:hypothetical protein LAZ67_7001275 [Cordylochernes scorpioides]
MYSDNGTNFKGAAKFLNEQYALLHASEIQDYITYSEINWHFMPPHAPHFGGIWESNIKSVKMILKKVIGSSLLTFEELTTFLTQIEATLNQRPLTPLSEDPNDLEALTPAHFLSGPSTSNLPETDNQQENLSINLSARWKHIQELKKLFILRWKKEYVINLQKRGKWKSAKPNVKIGDLVLIMEQSISSSSWILGRVSKTFHGPDMLVRTVELRTGKGLLRRPVNKVAVLPVQSDLTLTTGPAGSMESYSESRQDITSSQISRQDFSSQLRRQDDHNEGDHNEEEPKPKVIPQRCKFLKRVQKETETVSEYLRELKHLATNCEFGGMLEMMLRDRFVAGLSSEALQKRLLQEEDDVKLDRVLAIAVSYELAEKDASELHGNCIGKVTSYSERRIRERHTPVQKYSPTAGVKRCYRCGERNSHLAPACPHKSKACYKCKKIGHLSKVCKAANYAQKNSYVHEQILSLKGETEAKVTLTLDGKVLKCVVDTGSPVTLMPKTIFKKFWKVKLFPTSKNLKTLCNNPIKLVGERDVFVEEAGRKLRLIVVDEGFPEVLLGREWLKFLDINYSRLLNVNVAKVSESCIDSLIKSYANLFNNELGCLKKQENFSIGSDVYFRNYAAGPKWKQGTILKLLSCRHYLIGYEDQSFKRHINQLRPVKEKPEAAVRKDPRLVLPSTSTETLENHPEMKPSQVGQEIPERKLPEMESAEKPKSTEPDLAPAEVNQSPVAVSGEKVPSRSPRPQREKPRSTRQDLAPVGDNQSPVAASGGKHRTPHFEVNDLVLVKNYRHPDTGKLAPYFTGTYTIIEIISPNVVRIDRPNQPLNRDSDPIHVNKLEYYTENVLYITPQQPRFVQNPQQLSQDLYLSEFNHLTTDIFETQIARIIPPTTSQPFLHLNPDLFNIDRFKTNLM